MQMMDIKEEIERHGNLPLECDGFTRVFEYILKENNITFQGYRGIIFVNGKSIKPHYWIVSDKYIIDFALNMWFGKKSPNGILEIECIKVDNNETEIVTKEGARYVGIPNSFETDESIYKILTMDLYEH